MKFHKKYLTLFFILTTFFLNAQNTYSPVNFDYGRWVFTSNQKGPYWGIYYEQDTLCYYFSRDTLISNHLYRKLYYKGNSYSQLGYKAVSGYEGAFRDDTLNKRVWFGEEVAYDYNLSIGDTLKSEFYSLIVDKIDSASYCGKYFPRFIFKNAPIESALIENIGALNFCVNPYVGPTGYRQLECYFETNSNSCTNCAKAINTNTKNNLNYSIIYPNPTDGKILVTCHDGQKSVSVYSLFGYLTLDRIEKSNQFTLDLSSFKSGIYLLRIESKNGVYTEKIIKK